MVLQRLKSETRPDHERIEQVMDLPSRLGSAEAYRALLARIYGLYAPVERALGAVDQLDTALADIGARRKTDLLARDLAALGLADDALRGLPRCAELPALPGVAEALGCLYVIEGSTLGGQLITRQVAADLGISAGRGGAFFAGYGPETGPMWRRFGAALATYATTPEREAAMVSAARELFGIFTRWLAEEE